MAKRIDSSAGPHIRMEPSGRLEVLPPGQGAIAKAKEALREHSRAARLMGIDLGGRIRAARLAHRWTADELAARARISRMTLHNIETGGMGVAIGHVLEVCAVLGLPLTTAGAASTSTVPYDAAGLVVQAVPKRARQKRRVVKDDF